MRLLGLVTALTMPACNPQGVPIEPAPTPDGSVLTVPADYRQPDGQKLKLAFVKLPAFDAARRLGTLVFAPGGPGDSGVDFVENLAGELAPLRERYDIIGIDPRGTGLSEPVECMTNAERDEFYAREVTAGTGRIFASACAARAKDLLPVVGTENVARDLEVLRLTLGEEKLNYYGFSYGTRVGLSYLEQFPEHAGRFVLDSIDNPKSRPELDLDEDPPQRLGNETALARMTGVDVVALLAELKQHPLPSGDGRFVNDSVARAGLFQATLDEDDAALDAALAAAEQGRGDGLQRLADELNNREADGTYDDDDAYTAVNCLVGDPAEPPPNVEALAQAAKLTSPVFGEWLVYREQICEVWPVEPTWVPHDIHAPGAPGVLLLNNSRDLVTTLDDARAADNALEKAVLVVNDSDSHGVYLRGYPCADAFVNTYLLDGALPAEGTACG